MQSLSLSFVDSVLTSDHKKYIAGV